MAQIVEVSGDDVEEAVARGLRQLGLNRDQVEIEVVREGKRGFLGFGSEEAIVRLTAKASVTSLPRAQDRGRRGGGGGGGGGRGRGSRPSSPIDEEEQRQRAEGAARAAAEAADVDEDEEPPLRGEPVRESVAGGYTAGRRDAVPRSGSERGGRGAPPRDGAGRDGGGRGGRGGRGGFERGRMSLPTGNIALPVRIPGAPDEGPVAPISDAQDEIDLAGRTLRDLLTLLGLTETEISARDPETPGDGAGLMSQVLDITGLDEGASDELGVLIGRRGETLQSLQYLLNVIVSSRYSGEQIYAVDIEQYRRRREQALVELAHRIANEVRSTGDVITLEPMPPAERRIIHLALQNEEGVATASVGEGADRQVEIMPA